MVDFSGGGELGEVSVEVRANIEKLVAGFSSAKMHTKAFEADMKGVVGATKSAFDETNRLEGEYRSLARTLDPLRAAATRYGDQLVRINALQRAGMLSSRQAAAWQASALTNYKAQERSIRGVGVAAGGASFLMKGFVGLIGVQSVMALGRATVAVLKTTADIGKFAEQVGLTSAQLQEYRAIAKDFNLTQEEIDRGFKQFKETVSDAASGLERPKKLFDLLGVSLVDAGGKMKSQDAIFLETIDKLKRVGNEGERTAGLMLAFGDDIGGKMGPMVEAGAEGINELRQAVQDTGIVLSDEQIQKADQTAKKLEQIQLVLKAKIASVVVENADAIGKLADMLALVAEGAIQALGAIPSFFNFITSNTPALVQALNTLIPGLGYFAQAMTAVAGGGRSSVTVKVNEGGTALAEARRRGLKIAGEGGGGAPISLAGLLANKGRTPRAKKGSDVENVFDREMLREQEEHLRLLRDRSGNLQEINQIDLKLISLDLDQRNLQIDQQVKRKALTAAQGEKLKLEAAGNAAIARELTNRKLEEALIEQKTRAHEEMLALEESALDISLRLARTDEERRRIEFAILDLKHEQERMEIDKAIALAKEARDEARIAELTEQRLHLLENQKTDVQAFKVEHLKGFEKFRNDLPRTVKEINEQIENIRFDLFTERLQQAAQFAEDLGSAFGNAAAKIAQFENPLDVLKGLLTDVAAIFTQNFIEKPITDWATKAIGGPVAGQLFGKGLTGPDTMTVQQMNVALGMATQNLNMLSQAAIMAANSMGQANVQGIVPLGTSTAQASTAMQGQIPILGQFGQGLLSILGSLGGGGGSGGLGQFLGLGLSLLGGVVGAPGAGAGAPVATGAYGLPLPFPGFGGGGFTGEGRDDEVKGLVHANEWVFDAPTTRRARPLLEMISAGRIPSLSPSGMLGGERGARPLHLGGVHIHGANDDRSARRSARQATAEIQRRLGQVSRTGINK